jgi:hypothetical protein
MPSPFPGMDPYLEHPAIWPDVHNRLIVAIADALTPKIRPKYYASIEERVYLTEMEGREMVGQADVAVIGHGNGDTEPGTQPASSASDSSVLTVRVPLVEEVRETYLEVRETGRDHVVVVIEVLSPTNKRWGRGRLLYQDKRIDVPGTRTHLVEIDLLRAGEPMPVLEDGRASDYRILVSRGNRRPNASLYVFGVRQPIPTFPLPLKRGDDEPTLDIGDLLYDLYDRAGYDLRIDYSNEPYSPLRDSDAAWADELLRERWLR